MKPGVKAKQLYEITVQTTRESGLPQFKRTHCGHGIGLEMYDPPVLRETTEIPVEAGMVFCVEAPYYELGLGGIQVEDTVVVTPTGVEYLSPATKPLQILE